MPLEGATTLMTTRTPVAQCLPCVLPPSRNLPYILSLSSNEEKKRQNCYALKHLSSCFPATVISLGSDTLLRQFSTGLGASNVTGIIRQDRLSR